MYLERKYSVRLSKLATQVDEPHLELALKTFIYARRNPTRPIPSHEHIQLGVQFAGKVHVFHSAIACFYAPSDLCGPSGMYRQRIRCTPSWYGVRRHDTVFVEHDPNLHGMHGLHVARVRLLFSYVDDNTDEVVPCALVNWYIRTHDHHDVITGMWSVCPEGPLDNQPVQVIDLRSIVRGAHLLPKYGIGTVPEAVDYTNSLDAFDAFFVNPFIDYHCHELLTNHDM